MICQRWNIRNVILFTISKLDEEIFISNDVLFEQSFLYANALAAHGFSCKISRSRASRLMNESVSRKQNILQWIRFTCLAMNASGRNWA